MPLPPLNSELTEGQKIEVMKRFRQRYTEELQKLEAEMTDIITNLGEADHLGQFIGEQPEVVELRKRKTELDALERRRQLLGQIIERLDKYVPQQAALSVSAPNRGGTPTNKPAGGIKRY
jgi:hypothetical protein